MAAEPTILWYRDDLGWYFAVRGDCPLGLRTTEERNAEMVRLGLPRDTPMYHTPGMRPPLWRLLTRWKVCCGC